MKPLKPLEEWYYMVRCCDERHDWKKSEKTIRDPNCERLKAPFHYTTTASTPQRFEDQELFIARLHFTPLGWHTLYGDTTL